VIANFALTWDGRISTRERSPSGFGSEEDRRRLLAIRAQGDAVLVSGVTLRVDRMTLGMPDEELRRIRLERGQREYPLRVVVSGSGHVDPQGKVFTGGEGAPVVVYTTSRMATGVRAALAGVAELRVWEAEDARLDLGRVLMSLREEFGVRSVVCEGGGELLAGLLRAGCVDELCTTLCPLIFGGKRGISLSGGPGDWLGTSVRLRLDKMETIGAELFVKWRVPGASRRKKS
jgi:riboflavin-specific deaminase-like protein